MMWIGGENGMRWCVFLLFFCSFEMLVCVCVWISETRNVFVILYCMTGWTYEGNVYGLRYGWWWLLLLFLLYKKKRQRCVLMYMPRDERSVTVRVDWDVCVCVWCEATVLINVGRRVFQMAHHLSPSPTQSESGLAERPDLFLLRVKHATTYCKWCSDWEVVVVCVCLNIIKVM